MPLDVNTARIYGGHSLFGVFGEISSSSDYAPLGYWSGYSIPFFFTRDSSKLSSVVFLPDTFRYYSTGFSGDEDLGNYSIAFNNNDDAILCWSKIHLITSDVPPVYMEVPFVRAVSYSDGILSPFFSADSALNPQVAFDHNNVAHVVWEKVTPIHDSTENFPQGTFIKYSSEILFATVSNSGTLSAPLSLGKGFGPSIRIAPDNSIHILWFAADSSTADNFTLQYTHGNGSSFATPHNLKTTPSSSSSWNRYVQFQTPEWDVDSSDNISIGWIQNSISANSKIYLLQYNQSADLRIDSSGDFLYPIVHFLFKPNGEVVVVWEESTIGGLSQLHYSSTASGPLFSQIKSDSSSAQVNDFSLFQDRNGKLDAVLFGTHSVQFFKDIISGKDTISTVYFGSTAETPAYLDTDNKVWMIGLTDSVYSLLNFAVDDVGKYKDFYFPLHSGDVWQYGVTNIDDPDPLTNFVGYDNIRAEGNTTMPNQKTYIVLKSDKGYVFQNWYLRKDGFAVYQYSPENDSEYLRYDFSKSIGDSIGPYQIVQNILSSSIFGSKRREFEISGERTIEGVSGSTVADSIGIVAMGTGISYGLNLTGAIIDNQTYGTILSVKNDPHPVPAGFTLSQNYPNPFNPTTNFQFSLPLSGHVTLKIYDVLGREVATIVNEKMAAGSYTRQWNASGIASGIYFYRLQTSNFQQTRKLVLLK
jgi:Secretion system C-terminal sorting domain